MKIEEAAESAAAHARWSKERTVRRTKHGPVRTDTSIMCYRGNDPVAQIELPPDRDEMLRMTYFAARSFAPDVVSMTFDSYLATARVGHVTDPRTGKFWEPGGLQSYAEEVGFDDGVVAECMVTMVMNRAGDSRDIRQPYRVEGRSVIWLEDGLPPFIPGTGIVPENFTKIMDNPTIDQHMVSKEAPEWVRKLYLVNPERARWHMDIATVKLLETHAKRDLVVKLFAKPGSPQDQFFRTKFARSQIINPGDLN